MADNSGNMLARRSTRTFEDDWHTAHVETASNDLAAHCKRGCYDRQEKQPENEEYPRHSSSSSLSSIDPGSQHLEGDETPRESTESLSSVKDAVEKIAGRPLNFGVVIPGVYRCGYPQADDLDFLKSLGLKTIVSLVQKEYPEGYQAFIETNGIKHVIIEMQGTKKVDISHAVMNSVMEIVLDRRNYPILVHCNQGRHRTGCVVAVIRKVMGWNVDAILDEYNTYASPKPRETDVNYIQNFQVDSLGDMITNYRIDAETKCPVPGCTRLAKIAILTGFVLGLWAITLMDLRPR